MSDKSLPEVKVVGVDYEPCSKCGQSRPCVSLDSTAVIKEEYDRPCYSLALCSRCLRGLDRHILNYRPHWNRPGSPSEIDDVEADDKMLAAVHQAYKDYVAGGRRARPWSEVKKELGIVERETDG